MKWIPTLLAGALVLWLANGLRAENGKEKEKRVGPPDQAEAMRSLELFTRVFEKINSYYVDENIDPHELIKKAIDGMLTGLDPHSQFLDDRMYDDLMTSTQGSFGGLGIEISVRDNYPTVIAPIEGTPAYIQGVQGGDQIIEIEGEDTYGWTITQAIAKLRGPKGTEVHFKVRREEIDKPIEYTVTRDIIQIESVRYSFKIGDTGYIRVVNFAQDTADELQERMAELEAQGVKGLVLDLRYNPGGLLRAARDVSQLYLESGKKIVYTRGRTPRQNADYYSTTPENKVHGKGYPIVVLINEASASASEIVAGALQDWDAALIVGETSFGKGSVQTVFPMSETEALKLTTAKYYTPSGRCIHKEHQNEAEETAQADGEESEAPAPKKDDVVKLDQQTPEAPTPAETFKTIGGRTVTGGGGITPDIIISQPELTQFAIDLERKNYFFQFAIKWVARHQNVKDFKVTPEVINDFKQMLTDDKFTYEQAAWDQNIDYLDRGIRREVARRQHGSKAAYMVSIEGDEQLKRTLDLFTHGHTVKEFYAVKADELKPLSTEEIKRRIHEDAKSRSNSAVR
jgi:carboxyl-terminal processing protease